MFELGSLIFSLAGNMFNKNAAIIILDFLYVITTIVGHFGCNTENLKLVNFAQIACIVKASYQGVAILILATSWTTLKELIDIYYDDEEDTDESDYRYNYRNPKEKEDSDEDEAKTILTVALVISIIRLAMYANVAHVLGNYKKKLKA